MLDDLKKKNSFIHPPTHLLWLLNDAAILIVGLGQSACTVAHMGRLALEALKLAPTNK